MLTHVVIEELESCFANRSTTKAHCRVPRILSRDRLIDILADKKDFSDFLILVLFFRGIEILVALVPQL